MTLIDDAVETERFVECVYVGAVIFYYYFALSVLIVA